MGVFVLKQKKQTNNDDGWWIADWQGDPGRTLVLSSAKTFQSKRAAKISRTYQEKRYSHIRKIDLEIVELGSNCCYCEIIQGGICSKCKEHCKGIEQCF